MLITRKSPHTGKINTLDIDVTQEELEAWKYGTLIQLAMPRASGPEREFIKTGISPDDWKDIFKGEEE
jgi:hypothetical protein